MENRCVCCGEIIPEGIQVCYSCMNSFITDVTPVRHGHWKTNSDRPDSLICSVCNCGFDMWKHDPHNYCPNCGAKMDGDEYNA